MERQATKDPYERDQEEAERLVRPAPRIKPPRHDRRREETRPDSDPDVDTDPDVQRDKDLCQNYKTIGGSARIAARFLVADIVRGEGKKRIPVRNKETGEATSVLEETLKADPSKYEVIEEPDAQPGAPAKEQAPGEKPSDVPEKPKPKPKDYAAAGEALRALGENDPVIKGLLQTLGNPKSKEYLTFQSIPSTPITALSPLKDAKIEGIETVGDLMKAVSATPAPAPQPKEKPKPAETPKAEAKPALDPVVERLDQLIKILTKFGDQLPAAARPQVEKAIEDAKKTVKEETPKDEESKKEPAKDEKEPPKTEAPQGEEPAKEDNPANSKKPKKPKKPPEMHREKADPDATQAANFALTREVAKGGGVLASRLQDNALHPEDVRGILEAYRARKETKLSPGGLEAAVQKARESFYTTDPEKILPPAKVNGKPFEELDAKEQAEAYTVHKNAVIGMSLAVRSQVVESLRKHSGVPRSVADAMADTMLNHEPGKSREEQEKDAKTVATDVFAKVVSQGEAEKPVSADTVRKTLESVKGNPVAQRIAVANYQAQDYLQARAKFLSKDSGFNEQADPRSIAANMKAASAFLNDASEKYPAGLQITNLASKFRNRVMRSLLAVDPDKAKAIQPAFHEIEADEYDNQLKKWKKAKEKTEAEQKKYEAAEKKLLEKYTKETREKGRENGTSPYREFGRAYEEWLAKKGYERPLPLGEEPLKPISYDEVRGNTGDRRSRARKLWDRLTKRSSEEVPWGARVAVRYLDDSFYPEAKAMGQPLPSTLDRTAVYSGVEPYPKGNEGFETPYPASTQAQARDLTETDYNGILTAARGWLKEPVLSTAIEGIVPDTQFRAALDLAIRDHDGGRYSVGFHPATYNKLLARLAGEPAKGTLLTIREASHGTVYALSPTGEDRPMRASAQIHQFAVRAASINPELAFDLAGLSLRLAQEEQAQQEKKDEGQAQTQQKQGGEIPEAFKEHMKKKEEGAEKKDDKKDEGQAQQKQAAGYLAIKDVLIKTAHGNPALRQALLPALQIIKQHG